MAAKVFDCELNFARDVAVEWLVSPSELQVEYEQLKEQVAARDALIAERNAAIADRDKTIAKLATDLAVLQQAVKDLLARRGGGQRVPEGQGLARRFYERRGFEPSHVGMKLHLRAP